MSVRVTAIIYSGRRDPSWYLSGPQIDELRKALNRLKVRTRLKPASLEGPFGYRGFLVETGQECRLPALALVYNDIVETAAFSLSYRDPTQSVERFLFDTGAVWLAPAQRAFIDAAMIARRKKPKAPSKPVTPGLQCAAGPKFPDPAWQDPTVIAENNCYSYANDTILCGFSFPGYSVCHKKKPPCPITVQALTQGAKDDGLTYINSPDVCPDKGWVVALRLRTGANPDYHWLRRDSNGLWSHKLGSSPVQNTDDNHQTIANPVTCPIAAYPQFSGYFITVPGVVHITGEAVECFS